MSGFRAQARWQARWCTKLGSPLTAAIATLLAERLDPASPLGRRLDDWPGDAFADVLSLRVAGGLHALVRAGRAPELAAIYPPAPLPAADDLWRAMAPLLEHPELASFIARAPQTNEVGRSAVLAAGMAVARARTGLPLRLFELGASAGLNLLGDRYRIEAGGTVLGDPGSALLLRPDWEGPAPPSQALAIVARAGVDLAPLRVSDNTEAQRMIAYVWPDQAARLARMEQAIAIARADPPLLVAGDAADFVEHEVTLKEGALTLVFHSIAFQYFAASSQARIAARMAALGASATAAAPLGWLRYEMDDPAASAPPTLRLRLWPDWQDHLLAHAHPHGSRVQWVA